MQKATAAATALTVAAVPSQEQMTCQTMRVNIMDILSDPYFFSEVERLRANDSVYQCECVAQLQRWFRNVYRLFKEREASLRMGFADGSYTHIPLTA